MKKFLAVVLAAALALSLVACGGAPRFQHGFCGRLHGWLYPRKHAEL